MIDSNDVNLIIFDTDGTIIPSVRPVYEAIRRAFVKADWKVAFGEDEIMQYFGTAHGELYEYIAPEGESWEKVREKARQEYTACFQEYAETYPGVRETLEILRKRGYLLTLYSNASTFYFDLVKSALDIAAYFDYTECIGENNLTKPELIKKIKKKYGDLVTAVVGDRVHDIEAARETGSFSVGALYGYGNDEPVRADIIIEKFSDLLGIFDRRLPIFEKISEEIDRRKDLSRPYVLGINGVDCSGKTIFIDALARFLISRRFPVQIINLDDFHNPRRIRNAGSDPLESYYTSGFDIRTLVEDILAPAREKGEYSISLTLLDLRTDRYEVEKNFSFNRNTIVLLEGVYLFRKELASYIDFKIFLDIPLEESRRRAAKRDIPVFGERIMRRYDDKYIPVQSRYLEEYPPLDIADLIIDNRNWEYPVIDYLRHAE